jgi:hypothetical protein
LSGGGKKHNKRLLEFLAGHNCQMTPAAQILAELGLESDDITFLNSLGCLPGGWHPYSFSTGKVPGNQARLVSLGLIFINCKKREISLSDAGRFLLILAFSNM